MLRNIILLCILSTVTCLGLGLVQPTQKVVRLREDALKDVAPERRARLIDRLELYFGSLSKAEFGGVYDLRPEACRHGLSKDEWLKQVRDESPGRIQMFDLEVVYSGDYTAPENLRGEKWIAKGCGIYASDKGAASYQTSVSAVWADDEWYFCSNGIAVEGADEHYVRCSGAAPDKGDAPDAPPRRLSWKLNRR